MKKLWPFTFYIVFFAGIAFVAPFIVLYYLELGFSGTQIGLLTGIIPLLVFFSAPFWTGLADTTNRHRLLLSLALLVGVITLFLFPFLHAFLPVFLIAVLLNFFLAPVSPFVDSATMLMLADHKELYGRIRLGGTIGFGLAAPVAGVLVQNYGLSIAFWGSASLILLSLIVSQKLVYSHTKTDNPAKGRMLALLRNPRWQVFLLVAFAGGLNLAAINNYLFPFMKELGATESMMGLAILIGTISEFPTLYFGNRLINRFKPYGLLILSMVISGIRMLLFAASGTIGFILIVQLLNGLTFAAMWVAGVSYANENAPTGMSTTAQGLFSAVVMGIGMAVGGFIGGLLLERVGGRSLYLVFGVAVLMIVIIAAVMHRRLPAEQNASIQTVTL